MCKINVASLDKTLMAENAWHSRLGFLQQWLSSTSHESKKFLVPTKIIFFFHFVIDDSGPLRRKPRKPMLNKVKHGHLLMVKPSAPLILWDSQQSHNTHPSLLLNRNSSTQKPLQVRVCSWEENEIEVWKFSPWKSVQRDVLVFSSMHVLKECLMKGKFCLVFF